MEFKTGIYKHYKGKNYLALYVAKDSETLEDVVVYLSLYENELSKMWVRPLKMFLEKVDCNGIMLARFEFIAEK